MITYFSMPIYLQNGRKQILYLLKITEDSHWIEFIFKAVIGQYTIYIPALSLEKTMYGYPKREKKVDYRLKLKVSTLDIWIKQLGLKFKIPSSVLRCVCFATLKLHDVWRVKYHLH